MCEIGDVLCSLEISTGTESEFLSYLAGVVQPFPYYQVGSDPGNHKIGEQLPADVAHGVDPRADAQHRIAGWNYVLVITLSMVYKGCYDFEE